jgi:cytidine deaminase
MTKELLIQKALEASKKSYIPYSKFPVGAVILMNNGTIIEGANIENASYGLSMCAERNALYHAHLQGFSAKDFVAMAVIGPTPRPISPCGACRQVMRELMQSATPIYLGHHGPLVEETTPEKLLPYSFLPTDLTKR